MQVALDLGQSEAFLSVRNRLLRIYEPVLYEGLIDPADELVRAILGGGTRDAIRQSAFHSLRDRFALTELAGAEPQQIVPLIAAVDSAGEKAADIVLGLRRLKAISGDVRLDFLDDWSTGEALRYLEALPGVDRAVAAAVLNFSTLKKPALVFDAAVLRVLHRLGFLPPHVRGAGAAYDVVMPALEGWPAEELFEFHWLLKQLGQELCGALRTDCRACPLEPLCLKRGVRTFH